MTNSRAGKPTSQTDDFATDFTTTSTSYVDVTGVTLTAVTKAGRQLVIAICQFADSTVAAACNFILHDGSALADHSASAVVANYNMTMTIFDILLMTGQTLKIQCKTSAGTLTVFGTTSTRPTTLKTMEIG